MDPNKQKQKQTPNKRHETSENYWVEKKKGYN
jgi:hypothetical protein